MGQYIKLLALVMCGLLLGNISYSQEDYISGFEISVDQDSYVDFLRDTSTIDRNYTVGLRLGIYGEIADHDNLGLPWVRKRIDAFMIDDFIYESGFRFEKQSHSFVFTVNGFTPSHISDEVEAFDLATQAGYDLGLDRPFSSFTGFRSTRRIEGYKQFAHSAIQRDLSITTSFTFGFASFGLAQGIDNLLGGNRPDANLWDEDEDESYPTGQVMFAPFPLFMYSISAEAVLLRPLRKVVVQLRPELNVGYNTNIGLGIDLGKVMNVERHVDNLSYTDTHNPGIIAVNNEFMGLSIVAGVMGRVVLYNAHLNGIFAGDEHRIPFSDTKKLILEAYAGVKLQLFKKLEFSFTVNQRSSEFKNPFNRNPAWGSVGIKFLIEEEGEGCYE